MATPGYRRSSRSDHSPHQTTTDRTGPVPTAGGPVRRRDPRTIVGPPGTKPSSHGHRRLPEAAGGNASVRVAHRPRVTTRASAPIVAGLAALWLLAMLAGPAAAAGPALRDPVVNPRTGSPIDDVQPAGDLHRRFVGAPLGARLGPGADPRRHAPDVALRRPRLERRHHVSLVRHAAAGHQRRRPSRPAATGASWSACPPGRSSSPVPATPTPEADPRSRPRSPPRGRRPRPTPRPPTVQPHTVRPPAATPRPDPTPRPRPVQLSSRRRRRRPRASSSPRSSTGPMAAAPRPTARRRRGS